MTYTEKTNVVIVGAGKLYITAVGKKKKSDVLTMPDRYLWYVQCFVDA